MMLFLLSLAILQSQSHNIDPKILNLYKKVWEKSKEIQNLRILLSRITKEQREEIRQSLPKGQEIFSLFSKLPEPGNPSLSLDLVDSPDIQEILFSIAFWQAVSKNDMVEIDRLRILQLSGKQDYQVQCLFLASNFKTF